MLRTVALFELRYHLRRVSTWVYFALALAFPILAVSLPEAQGVEMVNGPSKLATIMAGISAFSVVVVAAISGMAVYRDIEDKTYELFFTTPIAALDYLGGRLLGTVAILLGIAAGAPLGAWIGSIAPWADHAHMLRVGPWLYLQPYLLISTTTVVATSAIFFAAGALTRNPLVIYLQGVVCLVVYLAVGQLVPALGGRWTAVLDPFAWGTLSGVTRYWTLTEMSSRFVPLTGVLLWNRLLWIGIGLAAVGATLRFFPRSAESLGQRRGRGAVTAACEATPLPSRVTTPSPARRFDARGRLAQFLSLTHVRLRLVSTDLVFLAMVVCGIGLHLVSTWGRPLARDLPVLPVTYLMTRGVGTLFLIVLTAVYAGELVWKDRSLKSDQLWDAQPVPDGIAFASQLTALTILQVLLLVSFVLVGMLEQAWLGYYRFELPVYFKESILLQLPSLMAFSVMALCVQTLLPNKFLGHAVVIGLFLGPELIVSPLASRFRWTFPVELYEYAVEVMPTYSDMNGYDRGRSLFVWLTTYWSIAACLLAVLAIRFARRGTDIDWRTRWRRSSSPWAVRAAVAAGVALFLATGASIYDGMRTSARYISSEDDEVRLARYERDYKRYERIAQPKITAVDLHVDLSPAHGTFVATGTYTLVNKTGEQISSVHVQRAHKWQFAWVRELAFDRPFSETLADEDVGYHIYQLQTPLGPGESTRMTFKAGRDARRFDPNQQLVANGTFFDSGDWFPDIGYKRELQLRFPAQRRRQKLSVRDDLPPVTDAWARSRNLFGGSADRISFRATVSTEPDQIAVAPGYLVREWTENGRRYFTYDMGDATMLNFYSFVSARYAVQQDRWRDVNLQVFYDPKHPYNITRMIEATKAGLEYLTEQFGPYQFRQFRILEFPRYRGFAQSFPNTVPFAESEGFIGAPATEADLDMAFYVTLHELAHQWWGHQVTGAFAEGSNILSEMMAEYSALMVVERVLGPQRLRLYLKHDLDDYLRSRRGEREGEQTLARVTRQGYVWYQKGSLAMYALKDAIGENRLNAAIRGYLEKVKFQQAPYTIVDEFLDALRAATPPEKRYLITDLFETITLFDNRAVSATWRETPEHRYAVTLKVAARKLRADPKGQETQIPIDDEIDIGVFVGQGKDERPLLLEKRRITGGETTVEVVVDERPVRAGIDPYNKLIDRESNDNLIRVIRATP